MLAQNIAMMGMISMEMDVMIVVVWRQAIHAPDTSQVYAKLLPLAVMASLQVLRNVTTVTQITKMAAQIYVR
jgi:hypothetical protein